MNQEHKIIISNYIDNELSVRDARQAEYLIKVNPTCKQYYEDLLEVNMLLGLEPQIVPSENFVADFTNKLELERTAIHDSRKIQKVFSISKRFALAASILLLVTFFAYLIINSVGENNGNPANDLVVIKNVVKPDVVSREIDPEMYQYLDILISGVNIDAVLAFDDEDFEVLENSYELGLLEDAVMANVTQENNSTDQED